VGARPAYRASRFGVDEKSSFDEMLSRWSTLRFMSYLYLPLLVRASAIVAGSAYPLTAPFRLACLCRLHGLLCGLLSSAARPDRLAALSLAATQSRSPGAGSVAFDTRSPGLRFASAQISGFLNKRPMVTLREGDTSFWPESRDGAVQNARLGDAIRELVGQTIDATRPQPELMECSRLTAVEPGGCARSAAKA
jgi:hypothetical protein